MKRKDHGGHGRGRRPGGARHRRRGERAQRLGAIPVAARPGHRRRDADRHPQPDRDARADRDRLADAAARPPPRCRRRSSSPRRSPVASSPRPSPPGIPIAVMIDDLSAARPQSGLSSASVVWQAPAEGGIPRYMAIFQETLPKNIGPVRSSRYYYIAWAAEWRAVYAHAGGSPRREGDAQAEGQRPVRLQRRRVPLQRHVLPDHDPLGRRTTCTRPGAKLARDRQARRRQGPGLQAGLDVRAGCAARGAAVRRDDHRHVPVQHDPLRLRPDDQHLPSLGDRREEADRRGDRRPDRAQERRRDADALRAAERRPSRRTSTRGRRRRQRDGLDLDQRPDDQGHLEEDRGDQADQVLSTRAARRSR